MTADRQRARVVLEGVRNAWDNTVDARDALRVEVDAVVLATRANTTGQARRPG